MKRSLILLALAGCTRPVATRPDNRASALVAAVRSDSTATIKVLLDSGLSADTLAPDGSRPLTEASRHGRVAAARLLIDQEARLDLGDSSGMKPMDYAVEEGHREMAALLVREAARAAGASPAALKWFDAVAAGDNEPGDWHRVLDGELVSLALCYAVLSNRAAAVNALRSGAGIPNRSGYAPLLFAARFGNTAAVIRLLGGSANPGAESGGPLHETPLMDAARDGYVSIGKALLHAGARVDQVDAIGQTALMWSVREGETEYAAMLLDAGADAEHRDTHGDIAMDIARKINHVDLMQLLQAHATRGHQGSRPR